MAIKVLRWFNVPDVFETIPTQNEILPIAINVLSAEDEDIFSCTVTRN